MVKKVDKLVKTSRTIFYLTTRRLEALSDGIFAISMTLLVLNLTLPEGGPGNIQIELHDLIVGQGYKFFNYALSFILLAVYWMVHHQQFHHIKRVDTRLLWINVFMLMLVALVPFSTDIVGDFTGETLGEMIFAGNLFVLSLLFLANWWYATDKHRLVDEDMDEKQIIQGTRKYVVAASVSLLVVILALFLPKYCLWFYLLIPVIFLFKPFRNH